MRNLTLFLLLLALCPGGTVLAQEPDPAPPETAPAPAKPEPPFEIKLDFSAPPIKITHPYIKLDFPVPPIAITPPYFKLDFTTPPIQSPLPGFEFARVPQEAPDKPRQRIGIKMGAVEAPLATHLGVASEEVVLILDVIAGSSASRAGLERYDVITHLDGTSPVANDTLIAAVQGKKPGDTLDLRILRRARALEITVKIEAPPTIVTTDASGRFRWAGLVSGSHYVTTTSKDAVLYVTPSVSQRYFADGTVPQQMDQSKILERLAEMEKRLARMEKLLEEARER